MRDAAVGFQCPSCIAEGKKSTRTGRTPYGGLRPGRPGVVSMTLIAINAAVWLLILATGGAGSRWVERLSLIPRGQCSVGGGRYGPAITSASQCDVYANTHWIHGVATGAPYQLLTSMFTHVEVLHIGFNMLALWFLGPQLELVLGRARYLALYLLSGLTGSALVYLFADPSSSTLGASGAIFGLMGALLVLALKVRADVNQLLMWIGLNFAFTLFGAGISWQGHLGGFVGGAALGAILAYAPRQRRTTVQVAGFSAVALLVVVAVVVRTISLG